MQKAPSTRQKFPNRTLENVMFNYQSFIAHGGNKKYAMDYMNCISEPLFNIPIAQVSTFNNYIVC